MGFGLRDSDWLEPDYDPRESMPCSTCSNLDPNPDGRGWCYCTENLEWTRMEDCKGCSDGEGEL